MQKCLFCDSKKNAKRPKPKEADSVVLILDSLWHSGTDTGNSSILGMNLANSLAVNKRIRFFFFPV